MDKDLERGSKLVNAGARAAHTVLTNNPNVSFDDLPVCAQDKLLELSTVVLQTLGDEIFAIIEEEKQKAQNSTVPENYLGGVDGPWRIV